MSIIACQYRLYVSSWLLSIAGVTIIGVLVELLLTNSPVHKFVRSIYAFFILFVIVAPIPGFFKNASAAASGGISLDTELSREINRQTTAARQASVTSALAAAGFDNCIVTFFGDKIYVNAAASTKKDAAAIISIVTAVSGVKPDAVEVLT